MEGLLALSPKVFARAFAGCGSRSGLRLSVVWLSLWGILPVAGRAGAPPPAPSDYCQRCHANAEFLIGKGGSPERDAALFVADSTLAATRHATLTCGHCHFNYDEAYPHQPKKRTVGCGSCHESEAADWQRSVHAANVEHFGDAPSCVTCHSAHLVLGAEDRRSPTHPLNEAALCARCHDDPAIVEAYFTDPNDVTAWHAVERYQETVHGRAVTERGLVVSATCSDCHEAHQVLEHTEEDSSIHRAQVTETCGACHAGVVETYSVGSHGRALAKEGEESGADEVPVCIDCHASHGVAPVDEAWKSHVIEECADCHEELYARYFETYHGKVTRLGGQLTAKCSDCHTAHGNLPVSDPASSVHPANLVATCAKCHEQATVKFAEYRPHADHHDRERHPSLYWTYALMSGLLIGVLGFFGTHSLLWLARESLERLVHRRAAPALARSEFELSSSDRGSGHYVWRFNRVQRLSHLMVIVSFFGLVMTGLPLHFAHEPWARVLVELHGGVRMAGIIHRVCAVITFGYFAIHLTTLAHRVVRSPRKRRFFWGPESMVPQSKDLADLAGMFRWFFGLGPQPKFERYSYLEKFDYWAVFWGVAVIGASGLLLWFPEWFARWLPGWAFNVATIVHGDEALLALCFIFTIHFFNGQLRPEKFPLDLVMFTGRATVDYIQKEHPLEYKRLKREGRLSELEAPPPPRWLWRAAAVVGGLAVCIGLTLTALVLWASLK